MKRASTAAVVIVVFGLSPGVARASLFGEENGPLTALVAQGAAQLVQAAETFAQLKQMYDETRKYVGMAEDAVNGFKEFSAFTDSVFRNPENALRSVMPEATTLYDELRAPQQWGRGTGELQRLVKVCLGGGDCVAFREAVSARQARDSISQTFGTVPVRRADIETVDLEAGRAISQGMSVASQSTLAGAQARALMEKCMGGTTNDAVLACQAAANLGQLMQVEQTAALNEQVAESNRLQALELAQKNAEAKRRVHEVLERQKMLEAGAQDMAPPEFRLRGAATMDGAR